MFDSAFAVFSNRYSSDVIPRFITKNDGKVRDALERALVLVSGTEIFCTYFSYEGKAHKSSVGEKIKQYEKDLMLQYTQVFILFE